MISPNPSAALRRLESGGAILNVESGVYFQVNTSGRFIWETLTDGVERFDLIEAMTVNFDIDHEQAAKDIDALLGQFDERSLISIRE